MKTGPVENLFKKRISSPVGELNLVATDRALMALVWGHGSPREKKLLDSATTKKHSILEAAAAQLKEYFLGKRTSFDLPLDFKGTDFQVSVWKTLRKIPFGKTWSYSDLAKAVKSPRAVRAVGTANSKNPLSIIIPCHRVIAKDGSLAGFGGGVHNKAFLLKHEDQKVCSA